MGNPGTFDPSPNTLRINDFTPGIVQFGRGNYPLTYTPEAPLGSAAAAARCMVRKGIGLVPFPTYASHMLTRAPANAPSNTPVLTGFFAAAPLIDVTVANIVQAKDFSDAIFIAFEYFNGGNRWRVVQLLNADLGAPGVVVIYEVNVGLVTSAVAYRSTAFCKSMVSQAGILGMTVAWNHWDGANIDFFPSPAAPAVDGILTVALPAAGAPVLTEVIAHASRFALLCEYVGNFGAENFTQSNDSVLVTDPPQGTTINTLRESFDVENSTGFGAWGSVATGELALIRGGNGAVIINGDLLAPSSAIKLPGVVGTGRVRQRATETPVGMIYVTEYDGVYLWNGGNTSEKISEQIPDDGFARPELTPVRGITVIHDCLNHLVFFPNNWVYDCLTRSWWKCEDPATKTFAVFSRADFNGRYMWAMTGTPDGGGNQWNLWRFDMLTLATSWTWTSNPLPVTMGELVDLDYCEIVASNPTATQATITVTPTVPAGVTPIAGGNAQTLTFTLPAHCSGIRLGQQLGYSDYNVQVGIVATGSGGNPAPTLHEISIGWSTSTRTGVS